MKIQFKELDYQDAAIYSIIKAFDGQQVRKSEFTIMDQDPQGKLFGEKGVGNKIDLSVSKLLQNVQQIQIGQGIPISESIPMPFPQFNIEMETGTGKTFVYLKSILELNRKYGFTKFIIVVPSVAIKEGVMKSIQITKDYFKAQMQGIVYRAFMYDSKNLNNVQAFASNENIEIMIINIQSFNSNDNIFNRNDMDALYGISPKQLVSETNPIVIIDEPQSVDNTENAQQAIAALNPSMVFRFSATHKNKSYPLLYKLGPVEAYQQKLVKQIEVAGIKKSIDGNEAYMKLIGIKATKKSITAAVEMYVKNKTSIEKKEIKLKKDDDVYLKSKRIAAYEQVGFVKDISAEPGNEYIEFSGEPSIIRLSQAMENDLQMKRGQIRKTIEEHLNKELKLNPLGIKVLSLFFIDNVANYRQYDSENNRIQGEYAKIFEEEYEDVIRSEKYKALRDRHVPISEVHDGYFSVDGKGKVKNTNGASQADESTYQIIMKEKEDLLTFYDESKGNVKKAHKLRFIFSHSALKEGWDNPNVFQICTLIETKDTITKRQKIGRGLRIAVNQKGDRVPGFDVNTLTIMANESYEDFAAGLQQEYEEEGVEFGIFANDIFSSLVIAVDAETGYKTPLGHEKSKELVQFLKENNYLDAKNKGTETLAKAIKEGTFDIPDSLKEIADNMKEKITLAIQEKFNVDKIEIKDRDNKVPVKLNKEALAGPFLELWERIKYKTTYSIQLNSEEFINQAASKLSEEIEVRITKLEYERHRLETSNAGIAAVREEQTVFATSEHQYKKAPDIVTYLQNETKLTRKTLISILKQSDTLRDFKRNPQTYMMETARIINSAKRLAMVDGIKYEKLANGEIYEQSLFVQEEIESYTDSIVPVHDNRSPYDHVIVDSSVEREFAEACERDQNVKFYIKLPPEFKIKTPLGTYNPDWALSLQQEGKEKLYFIVETKGSTSSEDLRPTELAKIRCGEKHFEAIDTGITFKRAAEQQAIYS
ncbi:MULTISPECIES: DEAD/DEAH box helicase family protein [Bacillus]|uniref:restriction endonuclease n=1 Tax=Bacillus TaxID=1386 RepID=UPI000BF49786|nr:MULTISPECIES: DEAD/DEAH box helicase family protein [Bacillus]MED4373975.1 DEAD/DEAH box helicase family protein [Bacillus licheniformis]MED4549331.1 DEAD/DEAH box helicase family protein [Bacillus licheniformis]